METLTARVAASTVSNLATAIAVVSDVYENTPVATSDSLDLAKALVLLDAARALVAKVASGRPSLTLVKAAA